MKYFVHRKSGDSFYANLQRRHITTLSNNSQRFNEFKFKFVFSTLETFGFRFFLLCILFPAVHRRCAHIHTNCAQPHAHKQTLIHIGTNSHNCTHALSHMHSYSHALTLACTYAHKHSPSTVSYTFSYSFAHSHSRTHVHLHTCEFARALCAYLFTHTHSHACTH